MIGYKKLRDGLIFHGLNPSRCDYAGNADGLEHVFTEVTGRKRLPVTKAECVCGVDIKYQHFVYDKTVRRVATLGSKCIQTYLPKVWTQYRIMTGKACPLCEGPKNGARSRYCVACRGDRMTCGKHRGEWFRGICEDDKGYVVWCRKNAKYGVLLDLVQFADDIGM